MDLSALAAMHVASMDPAAALAADALTVTVDKVQQRAAAAVFCAQMLAPFFRVLVCDFLLTRWSHSDPLFVRLLQVPLALRRGVHYFPTAYDMVLSAGYTGRATHPHLPAP